MQIRVVDICKIKSSVVYQETTHACYKLEFYIIKNKIEKVQNRRYIASGTVLRLTTFFQVPKRNSDTRLVYDLTACGLNEALWDPKFCMPSVENFLGKATHSSCC